MPSKKPSNLPLLDDQRWVELIWPLIWPHDQPLYLPDSEGNYYRFDKGDRVIYPKQVELLEAMFIYDGTFFGGAASGGKTYIMPKAGAFYLSYLALEKGHKGAHGAIFCETHPILYKRHISGIISGKTYPEWLGTFNQQRSEFRAFEEYGGWVMEYRSSDSYETNELSTEYAYLGIDESTNQPMAFYDHMLTRMRWTTAGVPVDHCPIILASNPRGIGLAWHKKRFVHDGRHGRPLDKDCNKPSRVWVEGHGWVDKMGHWFIQALPTDNPANSPKYLAELKSKPPKIRDAYYYGNWDSYEGQFFDLDPEIHTFPHTNFPPINWPRYLAIDWADTHTAVALAGAVDFDGNLWVYSSVADVGITARDFKDQMLRTFVERNGEPTKFMLAVADPTMFEESSLEGDKTVIEIMNGIRSDDEMVQGMRESDGWKDVSYRFIRAKNARIPGWRAMREAFHYKFEEQTDRGQYKRVPVTLPKIRIASHLGHVWDSLSHLQHDDKRPDDCVKTKGHYGPGMGDDEADTLRYLFMAAIQKEFSEETPQRRTSPRLHNTSSALIPGSQGGSWYD